MLATAAAVIHFAVAGEHFEEYWLFGVFMLVAAWAQLGLALASLAKPVAATWWAGSVGNALIVAVYVVTRTVGDVVGPTPSNVEPAGFGDVACTVAEALIVMGCVWLLFSKADRLVESPLAMLSCVGVAVVVATILSIALVDGGPEMVMPMHTSASGSAATMRIELPLPGPPGQLRSPACTEGCSQHPWDGVPRYRIVGRGRRGAALPAGHQVGEPARLTQTPASRPV